MPGAFNPDVKLPGLWTDKPDWLTHLRALAATGHINQADADQLAHFADHGWLLMDGAIEPEFVDTLVDDIRKLHRQPGYFATTDFRHGRSHKLNGNQPDALESIFDLYVNLQSSRHVCMHPRIIRFLSLVFQAKVLAFQQLLFQVTNGHRWHQDTAYVVVDTPTLLVATWIALQDIQEGSGELAYYDRSHRLPHYIFSNAASIPTATRPNYPRDIESACEARQLAHQRLLAEGGDVFFWTADLAHRSIRSFCPRHATAVLRDALLSRDLDAALVRGAGKRGIEPYWDAAASPVRSICCPISVDRPTDPRWEFYN